jgi:hypothetical protein
MEHTPKDGSLKTSEEEYQPPALHEWLPGNRVEAVRTEEDFTVIEFVTGHRLEIICGSMVIIHPSHETFPN